MDKENLPSRGCKPKPAEFVHCTDLSYLNYSKASINGCVDHAAILILLTPT